MIQTRCPVVVVVRLRSQDVTLWLLKCSVWVLAHCCGVLDGCLVDNQKYLELSMGTEASNNSCSDTMLLPISKCCSLFPLLILD